MTTTGLSRRKNAARIRAGLEIGLAEFRNQLSDEDAARRHIYTVLLAHGVCECVCGNREFDPNCEERDTRCSQCGRIWWFTANTFFKSVRNFTPWAFVIYLCEKGIEFNAHQLHELLGISYATISFVCKKVMFAFQRAITDGVQVPSSFFQEVYGRRSRVTPAGEHPREEESNASQTSQNAMQNDLDFSPTPHVVPRSSFTEFELHSQKDLTPEHMSVFECLSDERIHFDTICARRGLPTGTISGSLMMLEMAGFVTQYIGDWYEISPKYYLLESNPSEHHKPAPVLLDNGFSQFIEKSFQSISRKYVQLYLGLYACYSERKRWADGGAFAVCARSPNITFGDIINYVSPAIVQVPKASPASVLALCDSS
jgi:hypothetical protein